MTIKEIVKRNSFISNKLATIKRELFFYIKSDHNFKVKTFKKTHGRLPNLETPSSFSEKLLWSSENYRDSRFVWYADKYLVRQHVKKTIGEKYLIPIYDVIDDPNKLCLDKYPNRFVLNATHGSNMVILCNDKSTFDVKKAKRSVKSWLKENYYHQLREWHYNYIKPRVMVMEHIGAKDGTAPLDYKFFCFNGEPAIVTLDIDRFGDVSKRNVYNLDWNLIPDVSLTRPVDLDNIYPKPENFDEMKSIVKVLARGFEHVRVDLYNVDGKIYFGELTFLHAAAGILGKITPYSYNEELGKLFTLPQRNMMGGCMKVNLMN